MSDSSPSVSTTWPIWGHGAAVDALSSGVRHGRLVHAYLVAGPAGVGKGFLAQTFAQALCCQEQDRVDRGVPCGRCRSCRKIGRGTHPDVEIWSLTRQAASQRDGKHTTLNIETARQIRSAVALRPVEAPRRVVIIEDAETMQGPAQEALLKTLEEPPPAVVMVLLTDDAELLMPTIRSRCQVVELRPIATLEIENGLIASGVPEAQAAVAAALAHGKPAWAIQAVTNPSMLENEREAVAAALGWIDSTRYDRLVTAFRLGDGFTKRRPEVFAQIETALSVWRDLLLARCGLVKHTTYRHEAERIAELAAGLELQGIAAAVSATQRCLADLDANVRPRLALEGMVLQWPSPSTR